MKKFKVIILCIALTFALGSCSKKTATEDAPSLDDTTGEMDFSFSERDLNWSYNTKSAKKIQLANEDVEISKEGTYVLSGSLKDKMITVAAGETDKVQLVFDGVNIDNSSGPALYVKSADKVFVTAAKGSINTLSDGSSYSLTDGDSTLDGAIFSKSDLTINGEGTLNITGNYKHAVVSKDDLISVSCILNVKSQNVGLSGKDCVKLGNGTITISAGTDGVRSDNAEDATRGFVYMEDVTLDVTATNDGIQAETVLKSQNSAINIVSGGGYNAFFSDSTESYKGLKAGSDLLISQGKYNINSLDDTIHSNNTITIAEGELTLSSGDDGIHADTDLSVTGGNITISNSYEGLEGSKILISGGNIDVTASDDGLNAAGGNDGSQGEHPMGGPMGGDHFSSDVGEIIISGGMTTVNASGDGVDSNGTITVTGGTTLVSGPTNDGNSAIDCEGEASITGGVFLALGSSGMAQGFTSAENQGAILYAFAPQEGGSAFSVSDSSGNEIISFAPVKSYQCAVMSTPEIQSGNSYTLKIDGESIATIEMTSNLYSAGSTGMSMGGPGGSPGGGRGDMMVPGGNMVGDGPGGEKPGGGQMPPGW